MKKKILMYIIEKWVISDEQMLNELLNRLIFKVKLEYDQKLADLNKQLAEMKLRDQVKSDLVKEASECVKKENIIKKSKSTKKKKEVKNDK